MNTLSPTDITAHPQFIASVTEQLDQIHLTQQTNYEIGLFVTCLCVAAVFFYIAVHVGRRHKTRDELIAIRLRQIQTLERIWQMAAERRD
ncbi:hypothetical protein FD723_37165 (plasmid) [Nostoc sp. C052]|uniref:hypothetical protein n=1 Tax=Nostoc sp. C052 TaxID=2576902 RepID=UPI0015C2E52F|nr:hypothetical protein [Nostoc sp. C052]QLE45865.1 hypothetical protein FD723_37165 [Nostoc sp. C052]